MRTKVIIAALLVLLLSYRMALAQVAILVGNSPVRGGSVGDCLTIGSNGLVASASCGGGGGGVTTFSAGTTGLTPSTGTTGAVTLGGTLAAANGGTGVTTGLSTVGLLANPLSQFASTTSAQLLATLSDATGTGSAVFATSPTLTGLPVVQGLTTTSPGWYAQVAGDSVPRVRIGLNATDAASLGMGSGSATRDTFIERAAAANVRLGAPDAAAPVAQTLSTQNVVAGTSNAAGANFTINASQSTGTGTGGSIIFQTSPAVTATGATVQNPLTAVLTLNALSSGGNSIPQAIFSGSTSAAFPTLTWATDTTTGLYQRASNTISFSVNGTERWEMLSSVFRARSDISLGFTSGAASASADTGVSRVAAGVIGCGTGASASVAGQCYGATLRTGQTTVAGLPAAATAGAGARAYVTDAVACTFLTAVTGTGSTKCPVVSDGTNWVGG